MGSEMCIRDRDNYPFPRFNDPYYYATDTINCHSHLTYTMIKEDGAHSDRVAFIPHALPDDMFFKMPESEIDKAKLPLLGSKHKDAFVVIWVNRNAKRKTE